MIVAVSLLAVILAVFICMKVYNLTKDVTKFYAQGFDYGFHAREISSLWKLAKKCEIEEPLSLFVDRLRTRNWKDAPNFYRAVREQFAQLQDLVNRWGSSV